ARAGRHRLDLAAAAAEVEGRAARGREATGAAAVLAGAALIRTATVEAQRAGVSLHACPARRRAVVDELRSNVRLARRRRLVDLCLILVHDEPVATVVCGAVVLDLEQARAVVQQRPAGRRAAADIVLAGCS